MPSSAPTTWDEYAREIGLELQRRRIAAGLSQEALAHKAGITRTHYQQLERGYWKKDKPANPSIRLLTRLAQVLNLEVAELLASVSELKWLD